jgi:hypothetical protein
MEHDDVGVLTSFHRTISQSACLEDGDMLRFMTLLATLSAVLSAITPASFGEDQE